MPKHTRKHISPWAIEQVRIGIRQMNHRSAVFRMLKDELEPLGYWRSKPRGNPSKGYEAMRKKLAGGLGVEPSA